MSSETKNGVIGSFRSIASMLNLNNDGDAAAKASNNDIIKNKVQADVENPSKDRPKRYPRSIPTSKSASSEANLSIIPLNPSFDKASVMVVGEKPTKKRCDDNKTQHAIKTKSKSKPKSSSAKRQQQERCKISAVSSSPNTTHVQDFESRHVPNNENLSTAVCSPKYRENTILPLSSPSEGNKGQIQNEDETTNPRFCCSSFATKEGRKALKETHTGCFPYGSVRTLYPVMLSIIALTCSILCKESTSFVTLTRPIYIDSQHETVTEIGLFFVEYCSTDEFLNIDVKSGLSTVTKVNYSKEEDISDDKVFFFGKREITNELTHEVLQDTEALSNRVRSRSNVVTGDCRRLKLESSLVNDGLWNTARILVGFTTGIGFLFALALLTTTFWRTANLVTISAGIFLTYLCQSFAFLFYDTKICKKYICYRSSGTTLAILASACWFFAGIGTLLMFLHDRNRKHKEEIYAIKKMARKRKMQRQKEMISTQWGRDDYFSSGRRIGGLAASSSRAVATPDGSRTSI